MRHARALPLALLLAVACKGDGTGPGTTGRPPVDCAALDSTRVPIAMAVGQVRILSGDAVNCIRLAGQGAGSQYVAIVGNVGRRATASPAYRFATDAEMELSSAVAGHLTLDATDALGAVAAAGSADMHPVHRRLMEAARRLDPAAARQAAATPTSASNGGLAVRGAVFAGVPTVGQSASIRIPSLVAGQDPCAVFSTITATVRHVSARAIVMQDNASPANGFTAADFQAIATEFDELVYPADTAFFGTGSDIDANGGRAIILYTPKVNEATPREETESLLAGFFWAGDLFPRTGGNSCSQSNGAEIFYLLVPDPLGVHSRARTVADVREKTRGTIAHEFEHMLNAGWRWTNGASTFEAVWLDEALAHFAEEAVGRRLLGVGDFDELTYDDVLDLATSGRNFEAFFRQNLLRVNFWLRNPSAASPIDPEASSSLAVRGAAWALLRYAADHYSGGNARAFMRSFAMARDSGVVNLQARIGGAARVDSLITGWQVAHYTDDLGVPNLDSRYEFRSWALREAAERASNNATSLQVTSLFNTGTLAGSVRTGGGARYFRIPVPAGEFRAIQLTNGTGTEAGFPDARLVLLRTQ